MERTAERGGGAEAAAGASLFFGLEEFVAIIEEGSISAAARRVGIPRPSLSRRLKVLEDRLGQRLLHRHSRQPTPTAAGRELYERASLLVGQARQLGEQLRRADDVPRGLLRVSAPPADPLGFFGRLLSSYVTAHPAVELEVVTGTRHVDLVAEGFDLALRAGPPRDSGLIARRLLRSGGVAVCAPSYASARGLPTRADELGGHECLRGFERGERPVRAWPLKAGGAVPVSGRVASNDVQLLLHLALAGHGIALIPRPMAMPHLAEGRLIGVLDGVLELDAWLMVVFPDRAHLDPKVRAFLDLAAAMDWRGLEAEAPLLSP